MRTDGWLASFVSRRRERDCRQPARPLPAPPRATPALARLAATLAATLILATTLVLMRPAAAEPGATTPAPAAQGATAKPTPAPAGAAPSAAAPSPAVVPDRVGLGDDRAAMERFLDRLMLAESGGRDDVRNARSTALGAFQFIESTFLDVARRHLAIETANLTISQVLALRGNRQIARKAAEAFSRDNAALLAAAGLDTTFANLRLAFLVGPGGAIRLLKAPPQSLAIATLGAGVVQANPFMAGMTARDLALWADRNLAGSAVARARVTVDPARSRFADMGPHPRKAMDIPIHCNRELASCRHWLALATRRAAVATRVADRRGGRRSRR